MILFTAVECGVPLETSEVLPTSQFKVSSSMEGRTAENAALYSLKSWCANVEDEKPFIQVSIITNCSGMGFDMCIFL